MTILLSLGWLLHMQKRPRMSNQYIAKWSIPVKIWSTYLFVESPYSYLTLFYYFFLGQTHANDDL